MCTALLPPGVNPVAVNKYISYHIHKMRRISWLAANLLVSKIGVRLLILLCSVGSVLYFLLFVFWRMIRDWFNFHKELGFISSAYRPVAFSLRTLLWTFPFRYKRGNFMTVWVAVGISKRLCRNQLLISRFLFGIFFPHYVV